MTNEYFKRLNDTFGWRFLIYLFISNTILRGLLYYISYPIMLPLFKDVLKLPADDTQIYVISTLIPWTIKPVFGFLSDVLEIFGTQKRLWLYIGILFGSLGSGLLFLAYPNRSPVGITVCFMCIQLEIVLIDLMSESVCSSTMREYPQSNSDVIMLIQIFQTVGSLAASCFIGILADDYLYVVIFSLQCGLVIIPIVPTVLGWLPEPPVIIIKTNSPRGEPTEMSTLVESKMGTKKNSPCVRIKSSIEYEYQAVNPILTLSIGAPIVGIILNSNDSVSLKISGMAIALIILAVVLALMYYAFMEVGKPNLVFRLALYQSLTWLSRPSLSTALAYFYTADPECLPDGPHFTFQYYLTYIGIASSIAYLLGSILYQLIMSRLKYRKVLVVTTIMSCVGSLTDIFIILRLNVRIGIPDNVALILAGGVLQPILKAFEYSVAAVLLSKVLRNGMESSTVALMSGILNFVWMISEISGAIIYQSAGVSTLAPCNFDVLWILVLVCNVCVSLLVNIPSAFLIPDLDQDSSL